MKEDWIVISIFTFFVLFVLYLILSPYVNNVFSNVGVVVKSVITNLPLTQESLTSFNKSKVTVKNVFLGPQKKLYVGQSFNLIFDLNITGNPENIRINIKNCPLQGNLNAVVKKNKVIFDVSPTKTGLFSCYALISYNTIDGKQEFKERFSLPVYSSESQASFFWLILALIIVLIIVNLLKHGQKRI